MNLNIETLNKLTEEHYKLLLEADPNEKLISNYLNRSFCFEATYTKSQPFPYYISGVIPTP